MISRCCVVCRHLWVLAVVALLAGCTSTPRPTVEVAKAGEPADRIGVDDTFEVRVYGEPELTGAFRVASDGTIDYPLVGRVQVGNVEDGVGVELAKRRGGAHVPQTAADVVIAAKTQKSPARFDDTWSFGAEYRVR